MVFLKYNKILLGAAMEDYSQSIPEYLITGIKKRDINSEVFKKTYTDYRNKDIENFQPDKRSLISKYRSVISKYRYEELSALVSKAITVSLTSYPARIWGVSDVLKTIFAQTVQPDHIRLCLVCSDFPGREADLPENLTNLIEAGKISIRWSDFDLKPHNKYFHTMLDYPDDIVLTIDDDIYYDPDMIEKLYLSYLEFPDFVSANRTHLITFDANGRFEPYMDWLLQQEVVVNKPAMQLFATGVAGVLYPPHLLNKELFNRNVIEKRCIYADDIWLKAIEIFSDVPTVQTARYCTMKILPNSQQNALLIKNTQGKRNDLIITSVSAYFDELYGRGYLENKIRNSMENVSFTINDLLDNTREMSAKYQNEINSIYDSESWKIGQAIVNPMHKAKEIFNKICGKK